MKSHTQSTIVELRLYLRIARSLTLIAEPKSVDQGPLVNQMPVPSSARGDASHQTVAYVAVGLLSVLVSFFAFGASRQSKEVAPGVSVPAHKIPIGFNWEVDVTSHLTDAHFCSLADYYNDRMG